MPLSLKTLTTFFTREILRWLRHCIRLNGNSLSAPGQMAKCGQPSNCSVLLFLQKLEYGQSAANPAIGWRTCYFGYCVLPVQCHISLTDGICCHSINFIYFHWQIDCDESRQNHFAMSEFPTTGRMTPPAAKMMTVVEMIDNQISANILLTSSAVGLLSKTEYCALPADFITNTWMNNEHVYVAKWAKVLTTA